MNYFDPYSSGGAQSSGDYISQILGHLAGGGSGNASPRPVSGGAVGQSGGPNAAGQQIGMTLLKNWISGGSGAGAAAASPSDAGHNDFFGQGQSFAPSAAGQTGAGQVIGGKPATL